jgi:hypothetical protein
MVKETLARFEGVTVMLIMVCIFWGMAHCHLVSPLTPELNPSKQPCSPGFFTGDFKF